MNAEKLAKIRALAEDVRGDPATREIARRVLERYEKFQPPPRPTKPFVDRRHPGRKTSSDWDRHKFMDLEQWGVTANGNRTHLILFKETLWRIVLFRHKKSPTWGWLRINTGTEESEFSGKFGSLGAAHEDAWISLMEV